MQATCGVLALDRGVRWPGVGVLENRGCGHRRASCPGVHTARSARGEGGAWTARRGAARAIIVDPRGTSERGGGDVTAVALVSIYGTRGWFIARAHGPGKSAGPREGDGPRARLGRALCEW